MLPAPPLAPPYWAVVFVSALNADAAGYAQTADAMVTLAMQQPGYLGHDSARGADGLGVTVSYWQSEADIAAWRQVADHRTAQQAGRGRWYQAYTVHIARVERAYAKETRTS